MWSAPAPCSVSPSMRTSPSRWAQDILASYELDFAKHAPPSEFLKFSAIWGSVPQQLAKPNSYWWNWPENFQRVKIRKQVQKRNCGRKVDIMI